VEPIVTAVDPLPIVGARHWKIGMPFRQSLEWGSGSRPAATRLIVELALANGVIAAWGAQ
jgi:L-rhamnonate dehydratase